MKRIMILLASIAVLSLSSCGSMTEQDAYYIGYGAGTLLRNMAN